MKESLNNYSSKNNSRDESADKDIEAEYNPFEINLPSFSLEIEEFLNKYSMSSNFYDGFPELDDSQKEHCELNEDWEDNYIEHNPNLRNDFRVENNFQNFDFLNISFKINSKFDNSYMFNSSNSFSTNINSSFSEITRYNKNDKPNIENGDDQMNNENNFEESIVEINENESKLKQDKFEKEEEAESLNILKDEDLKFDESNKNKNYVTNLKENYKNNFEEPNENIKKKFRNK